MAPLSTVAAAANGTEKTSVEAGSKSDTECPAWVAKELGVPVEKVTTMEVPMSKTFMYRCMTTYLATISEGIRPDAAAPTGDKTKTASPKCTVIGNADTTESSPKLRLQIGRGFSRIRGHGPPPAAKDGKPVAVAKAAGKAKAAAEVNAERASKAAADAEAARENDASREHKTDADAKTEAEVKAELEATAECKWDGDEDIVFNHFAVPRPVNNHGRMIMYHSMVFYAASRTALEKLGNDALIWTQAYEEEKKKARKGSYVLCTLELTPCGSVDWRRNKTKASRPLESIFLKSGQRKAIVADFKNFAHPATKSWYVEHGLPYRRSYLFYGPPGTGKTSMLRALAGELGLTVYFLCLSDKNMGNLQLQRALAQLSENAMIVLEDVDVLFNRDRVGTSQSPLTFSGLLNALDGLISEDGVLTVMTTNHIDRLDPALVRAGRVDRRFSFDSPDRDQVAALFASYYPKCEAKMPAQFAERIFSRQEPAAKSIATLQQHFIFCQQDDAKTCLERIDEFFEAFFPHDRTDPKRNIYV